MRFQNASALELVDHGAGMVAIVGLVIPLALGCGLLGTQEPPSAVPSISGTITALHPDGGGGDAAPSFPHVLIEEMPGLAGVGDKAFIGFLGASIFVRKPDGSWRRGNVLDLVVGAKAQAWVDIMLQSYPGVGSATDVAMTN